MIEAEQGYLIIARNSANTDYVQCARVLAKSIRHVEPAAKICLVTDSEETDPVFDFVKPFPYAPTDDNPFAVDWQAYWASPFRETMKLEADMIVPRSLESWWPLLRHKEVVIAQGCYDFRGNVAKSRRYRRVFDENGLPDLYNAITYWRLSDAARDFFSALSLTFATWPTIQPLLKFADKDDGSTDLMYAITAQLIGPDRLTLPPSCPVPRMVHMKPAINATSQDDWAREMTWELTPDEFRINAIAQHHPVHYYSKTLAKELEPIYDRLLGRTK